MNTTMKRSKAGGGTYTAPTENAGDDYQGLGTPNTIGSNNPTCPQGPKAVWSPLDGERVPKPNHYPAKRGQTVGIQAPETPRSVRRGKGYRA